MHVIGYLMLAMILAIMDYNNLSFFGYIIILLIVHDAQTKAKEAQKERDDLQGRLFSLEGYLQQYHSRVAFLEEDYQHRRESSKSAQVEEALSQDLRETKEAGTTEESVPQAMPTAETVSSSDDVVDAVPSAVPVSDPEIAAAAPDALPLDAASITEATTAEAQPAETLHTAQADPAIDAPSTTDTTPETAETAEVVDDSAHPPQEVATAEVLKTTSSAPPLVAPPSIAPGVEALAPNTPAASVMTSPAAQPETAPSDNWETFIGTKLLSYIGIGILVLGLVSLLTYSLTQMGPTGRVGVGMLCGGGLLGLGFWLERNATYTLFGRILMGGGWSVLYFLAYGIYHIKAIRIVNNPAVGTMALALVASGILVHTLRYRSQALTGVALLMSYVTLFLTPISMYTHMAGLVLGFLVMIFSYRFRWLYLRFAAVLLLYGGYGAWRYFNGARSLPEARTEYLVATVFLVLLWIFFKLPDFAKRKDGESPWIYFWTALLNPIGLALSRKLLHFTFGTRGNPATAFFFGLIYLALGQGMRWRERMVVYRLESTFAVLMLMTGLWSMQQSYAQIMVSWMMLGALVFCYSLFRKDRYFRDIGHTVVATATLMALGGQWPQIMIRKIYALATGEAWLNLPTSLPQKAAISGLVSGRIGLIGAGVVFLLAVLSFHWLRVFDKENAKGEPWRDLALLFFGAVMAMWASHKLNAAPRALYMWQGLGLVLFGYGVYQGRLATRLLSHTILLWSMVSGVPMDLTGKAYGYVLLSGAVLLYLDGFLTFQLNKRDDKVGKEERTIERGLVGIASIVMMIAASMMYTRPTAMYCWLAVGALLFVYDLARGDKIARYIAHGVLTFTGIFAVVQLGADPQPIALVGAWKASRWVIHLVLGWGLFLGHAVLLRYSFRKQAACTNKEVALFAKERLFEEMLLISAGNLLFGIAVWYTLPSLSIALAFALSGVVCLELGVRWKRDYLHVHAGALLSVSGIWLFTSSLNAYGLLHGFSRRLLASVPVLGLWTFAGFTWQQHMQQAKEGAGNDTTPVPFFGARVLPLLLSYANFAAVLVLLYYHAHGYGMGWTIYAGVLLALTTYAKKPRYIVQSLIAAGFATVSFCNLAGHLYGPPLAYLKEHPALIAGPLLIFGVHLLAKMLNRSLRVALGPRDQEGIFGFFATRLRYSRILLGMMFCVDALFIICSLMPYKLYSLGFGLLALFCGGYGLIGAEKSFRWVALSLFAAAVGKIVLLDVFHFSTQQKIITFISVGIALLSVSFLYNRFKDQVSRFLLDD